MRLQDGVIKNALRSGIKLFNQKKYNEYVKTIQERGSHIPDFSLLTSDCMGGLIYHTMGRKFLSPTINLSIKDSDFIRFLLDISYYLEKEIRFTDSDASYPKGVIGEGDKAISINFEHYKSEDDARKKWNDRKQRLTENIYVVVADQQLTDQEVYLFKNLGNYLPIKRKVMFTWDPQRADGREIFCVKHYNRKRIKNWSKIRKDGFRDYEIFFDYIAWLDMKDDFMLEHE